MKTHCLILILLCLGFQNQASASLGDSAASVFEDQAALRSQSHRQSQSTSYTTHELVNQMNTVTEFVGADGTVFAIKWQGVRKPNLSSLLGSYFSEYQAQDSARPVMRSRQPVRIQTADLVVTKEGHMRDIRGMAYLPARLPSGVQAEDLP